MVHAVDWYGPPARGQREMPRMLVAPSAPNVPLQGKTSFVLMPPMKRRTRQRQRGCQVTMRPSNLSEVHRNGEPFAPSIEHVMPQR